MVDRIKWQGVVVHHTRSHDVDIDIVRQWHQERGWDEVGYHFLIRSDGSVEEGCSLERAGCHARGRNQTHLGVALSGCFSGEPPNHLCRLTPTNEQLDSLTRLLYELHLRYNFQVSRIERHHALCPGSRLDLEDVLLRVICLRDQISREQLLLKAVDEMEAQLKAIREVIKK